MGWSKYVTLAQLGRRRFLSYTDYIIFQRHQAKMTREYLEGHGISLNGKSVLDLGSGLGGYTLEWRACGGHVFGLDLAVVSPVVQQAGIPFLRGDAQRLPFASGKFEVVFCASLIEHVPSPEQVLAEIYRVLQPGGICYLSFPPFYSPWGGHEFSPFHYLGEATALRLAHRDQKTPEWLRTYYNILPSAHSFAETYVGWGLYRVTIARMRRCVKEVGFTIRHFSTRYFPVNLAAIPVMGEVLAWHVQWILEK